MPRKPRGYWSKEKVVEHIQALVGQGEPIDSRAIIRSDQGLMNAARMHYGSWATAVETAGFDYSKHQLKKHAGYWSKEKVLEAIEERRQTDRSLRAQDVQKEQSGLYGGAIRHFGSWRKAAEAAKH